MKLIDRVKINRKKDRHKKTKYILFGILILTLAVAGLFGVQIYRNSRYTGSRIKEASLNNGDTLELSFGLSKKDHKDASDVNYEVEFYDSDDRLRASMILTPDGLEAETASVSYEMTVYTIEDADSEKADIQKTDDHETGIQNINNQKTEIITMMSSMDEDGTIHLTLDAIDVDALSADESDDAQTGSAIRLIEAGIFDGAGDFYVRVRAESSEGIGRWVKTNTTNLLMGEGSDAKSSEYTLQNARHLFNLRFIETMNTANEAISYRQIEDISWGAQTYGDFPTIESLGENSSYYGQNRTRIDGLRMTWDQTSDDVGLFGVNNGEISDLILTNVYVDAAGQNEEGTYAKAVGAVCGINRGQIKDTKVEGGWIEGYDNVGAIAGRWDSESDAKNLTNAAQVCGHAYVGGLVGRVSNYQSDALTFSECKNEALVGGSWQYVGGLIGYAYNVAFNADESSPSYMYEAVSDETLDVYSTANDVGGIVGFANRCTFTKTSTGEGIVIGQDHVGGIVGYVKDTSVEKFALDGDGGENHALVLGHNYVGGITGQCRRNMTLQNWGNYGYICASGDFSGGIVGRNDGTILECDSKMTIGSESRESLKAYLDSYEASGSYVGGIAGLNAGRISSSDMRYVVSVLSGDDHVGGIVGCNLKTGIIENYALSDGYIWGDAFVGGYAGVNFAQDLLKQEALEASPTLVYANLAAGGVIGANFAVIKDTSVDVNMIVSNEKGSVISEGAFAGGMIGLNMPFDHLYYHQGAVSSQIICDALDAVSESSGSGSLSVEKIIETVFDAVDEMGVLCDQATLMTLTSSNISAPWETNGRINLALVKGAVCVGGVMGYSDEGASLVIKNIYAAANITATDTVNSEDGGTYACAGAITGYVNGQMTLDHCDYADDIVISDASEYVGGLAELNQGQIINCDTGKISASGIQALGGIVGVNLQDGVIKDCRQTGSVEAKDSAGGIAAVNRGQISACEQDDQVSTEGARVGGIAGVNEGTVTDCASKALVQSTGKGQSTDVYSAGNCVGGIAGYNRGTIENCETFGDRISGDRYVGGIAGYQMASSMLSAASIKDCTNRAHVYADNYAGGITGATLGMSSITDAANEAEIEVTGKMLGGISAYVGQGASLIRCENDQSLGSSTAENIGGIAGKNAGRIEQCSLAEEIKITGTVNVGGFAGYNIGTITTCSIGSGQVTLQANEAGGAVGAVSGINEGSILNCASLADAEQSDGLMQMRVSTNMDDSAVGGVAGINEGQIQGVTQSGGRSQINVLISVKNEAEADAGGIAGINNNTISDYMFVGYIEASGSENHGIGGITGSNHGAVSSCVLSDIRLNRISFSTTKVDSSWYYTIRVKNTAVANVGGIAGINSADGTIESSTLAKCYIRVSYGFVGGIAGDNSGLITQCEASKLTADEDEDIDYIIKIYVENGYAGGLSGYQRVEGKLRDSSTGCDWIVMAGQAPETIDKKVFVNTAAGGISGYLEKKSSYRSIQNHAAVVSTGGLSPLMGEKAASISDTPELKSSAKQ